MWFNKFVIFFKKQIPSNMVPSKCTWIWIKPHSHLAKPNVHWNVGHVWSIATNAIHNNVGQTCHVKCHPKYINDIWWFIFLHSKLGLECTWDCTYNKCGQVLLIENSANASLVLQWNQWRYNFNKI